LGFPIGDFVLNLKCASGKCKCMAKILYAEAQDQYSEFTVMPNSSHSESCSCNAVTIASKVVMHKFKHGLKTGKIKKPREAYTAAHAEFCELVPNNPGSFPPYQNAQRTLLRAKNKAYPKLPTSENIHTTVIPEDFTRTENGELFLLANYSFNHPPLDTVETLMIFGTVAFSTLSCGVHVYFSQLRSGGGL